MFTGIIEAIGKITAVTKEGSNCILCISTTFKNELKIDQSIAHNGVCLTVTGFENDNYLVTAIDETLLRTNLGKLKTGDSVNLERCLQAGARLDGHIVQGHVDQTAECISVKDVNGSWLFNFRYKPSATLFTVEKGSVCVNGVSLTVVKSENDNFSVAVIPYTYQHTNFKGLKPGDIVNLEFDILGKYVSEYLKRSQAM